MTKKIANVVKAEINTLESEGKALAKMWSNICRADRGRFTNQTGADGFDTRLGKLMQKLKAESDAGRISSARLKDCGINGIDKRRRAEALWFVENEADCREFIKASKKGFTSLTALQAAMKKASKAEQSTEPKADTPVEPKAEDKSNVGLDKPTKLDADTIAEQVFDLLDTNGVSLKEFEDAFAAIKAILKDEDTNKKAVA